MEPIIIMEGVEIAAEILIATFGGGWAISEALPFIKGTKHNGTLHLVWNVLKAGIDWWKRENKTPLP